MMMSRILNMVRFFRSAEKGELLVGASPRTTFGKRFPLAAR